MDYILILGIIFSTAWYLLCGFGFSYAAEKGLFPYGRPNRLVNILAWPIGLPMTAFLTDKE